VGDTADIRNAYNWNVSSIARAFNLHRNTVSARLKDAGVQPVGRERNAPLYALADAGPALFAGRDIGGASVDPDQMDPQSRRAWFQSENERLKFEQDQRHLVPDYEVAQEYSVLIKALANGLDSLPDELERDCGLSPEALESVQAKIDAMREIVYTEATE
tara:strand:- start:89 stop:568 length:480 start_codon:yes stop_codon:yes gene_type:complete